MSRELDCEKAQEQVEGQKEANLRLAFTMTNL